MASYSIEFKPSVEKDLRDIPGPMVWRLWEKMEALADQPLPRGVVKIAGAESLYRLRVGDYRVIYGVERAMRHVVIHHVRHRREAYRKL